MLKMLALILAPLILIACSDPQPVASQPASENAAVALPAEGPAIAGNDADAITDEIVPAAIPDAADSAKAEADYLGRWTGVEGMYLVVAKKPGGSLTLEMQWDLDNKGTFDGSVTAEGVRFMRNGVAEIAVHTNGEATGLKYLAGKIECLTVKPGEGYCRG